MRLLLLTLFFIPSLLPAQEAHLQKAIFNANGSQEIVSDLKQTVARFTIYYKNTKTQQVIPQPGTCSGIVISQRHILTAAHCLAFTDEATIFDFFAGSVELYDQKNKLRSFAIESYKAHSLAALLDLKKKNSRRELYFDLAVVTLVKDLPFWVKPYPLEQVVKPSYTLYMNLLFAGFGSKNGETHTVGDFQVGMVDFTFPTITYHLIIAPQTDTGLCSGDSGGPLFTFQKSLFSGKSELVLIGITSAVSGDTTLNGCGEQATFVLIEPKLDFIRSVLEETSSAKDI